MFEAAPVVEESAYREILKRTLLQKSLRRPGYSLRALSRHVGVSPASLSQLISGKRQITPKMAEKIVERLGLEPGERAAFLLSALKQKFPSLAETFARPTS